jgi:hypothetical protein
MSKALGEPNTEPRNFTVIFEVRWVSVIMYDAIVIQYV